MCGITGLFHFDANRSIDRGLLEKMNGDMTHRGPDSDGFFVDGPIGLGMRRLAIIDVDGGRQPLGNEDGSVQVVCNGEIYNFQNLRQRLEEKGHRFKSRSDVEVIAHLYEDEGVDCVKSLRGMYAFALWDAKNKRLLLARDRIGKKPLAYFVKNGLLGWASEIAPLLRCSEVSREIDPSSVDLYFGLQYIPSPHSIYREIRKLPPAHRMIVEKGAVRIERYWDPIQKNRPALADPEEAKELIREKLTEAVRIRMISDVPLGAFLSGGIDSSLVVGLMSRLSDRPVKTFSIGFDEGKYSELPFAREVANRFGADHTEFVVKPEMADVLPKLARHYGEPFGDSSALPTYYVSRETRRHVTVALNGDGGDETFAGYNRYPVMKRFQKFDVIPGVLRRAAASAAKALPRDGFGVRKVRRVRRALIDVIGREESARFAHLVEFFTGEERSSLLTAAGRGDASIEDYFSTVFNQAGGLDFINRLLYADVMTNLPEALMAKVDIATMANSLEGRSPFLDQEFVELSFRIPGNWKLKDGGSKWLLKEAFRDMLPDSIFTRPKRGFEIPISEWFRGRLRPLWKDIVLSREFLSTGLFSEPDLKKLLAEHDSGKFDHGPRMWLLLMFGLWNDTNVKEGRMAA